LAPSGEGTYLRRALCCVAAAAGSVLRAWPPLYGFMHGHELAIDGTRIDTGLHALQGKRSCKRISRGFIKKKWYTATTRQWQRRPWRQRTTAYKITHTPTVVLYMQISKRI